MDCIILAGGYGKRLQEIISDVPKPLAPIRNRPFLEILLTQIENSKIIDRVIFSVGYKADMIIDFISKRNNQFQPVYIKEKHPLKTGGAVQRCAQSIISSNYFVMNGDSYFAINWTDFFNFHQEHKAYISIACTEILDASRFGTVEIDENQRIINFMEKQTKIKHGIINGGIYCFKKGYLPYYSLGDSFSLESDLFPKLIDKNIYGYQTSKFFIDIGTPSSYKLAKQNQVML